MIERLERIAANPDPRDRYASAARLQAMLSAEPSTDPREQLVTKAQIAQEVLHTGRLTEAAARFQELLRELEPYGDRVPASFLLTIREAIAIAHLKIWEQEHCVVSGEVQDCLLPIQPDGGGKSDHAARMAAESYESMLQVEPDNLSNLWLLNLAYMMLGEYPESVPDRWLISPEAFDSEFEIGHFPEIAAELELDVLGHAGGSVMDDFDADGDLDVVVSAWSLREQLRLFSNNGDGTFIDRTIDAGLNGLVGGLNLVQADYNNDGFLDVFVLRGGWMREGQPNSLLRNNGDGRFEDVTEEAGLLVTLPTQTATWGDYDDDGWVDLYIGNESAETRHNPNQLFRNNGNGTFTDVAAEAGAAVVGFVKAVVSGDIDNDGRLDLFISRLGQPNVLLRNEGVDANGRLRFSDVTAQAGVAAPIASFPAWFWDYDNDGWHDIFVSGYRTLPGDVAAEYLGQPHQAEMPRLYRNDGHGTFRDVTRAAGLDRIMYTMGSNYGDLDNDGYPDFYVGTGDPDFRLMVPNRMFRNAEGRFFQDVTTSGGFGHLQKGHAIAFGDLDNDGDQDIYSNMGGALEGDVAINVLFENPGHGNRWITLRLEGVRSNRAAIGARIRVSVQTLDGQRDIYATVSSGGSFGANSLQQEIGLGGAQAISAIEITWPASGRTDTYTNVDMERTYHVREGAATLTAIEPN